MWAPSPRGSRCTFHPAGRLRLHPTWLGAKLCSTDGDVENIHDIFQTGLLSYHESLRLRRARMSEMGAWDLFPPPSSSLGSVVRQERGLQPLPAISARFWGRVVGVLVGSRYWRSEAAVGLGRWVEEPRPGSYLGKLPALEAGQWRPSHWTWGLKAWLLVLVHL